MDMRYYRHINEVCVSTSFCSLCIRNLILSTECKLGTFLSVGRDASLGRYNFLKLVLLINEAFFFTDTHF